MSGRVCGSLSLFLSVYMRVWVCLSLRALPGAAGARGAGGGAAAARGCRGGCRRRRAAACRCGTSPCRSSARTSPGHRGIESGAERREAREDKSRAVRVSVEDFVSFFSNDYYVKNRL